MIIYLVRHGESEGTASGVYQGQLDSELTYIGLTQAQKLARRFKNINDFEIIYTSPLKRAKNTAIEIFKNHTNKELIEDERLKEKSHGDFTGIKKGTHYEELDEKCKIKRKAPNGENMLDQKNRVEDFMKEILKRNKNCIISSHQGVILMILHILNIYSLDEIAYDKSLKPKNTCVYKLEIDSNNEIKILIDNCATHLD